MRSRLRLAVPLAVPLAILAVLSGCAGLQQRRAEPAGITVVKVPTAIASVVAAEAHMESGRLVVSGKLRRMHEVKLPGHIDVTVCGPDGALEQKSVAVPGLSSKRKGAMTLLFTAHLTKVPPSGSKVTVGYHAPPFVGEEAGCG